MAQPKLQKDEVLIKVTSNSSKAVKDLNLPGKGQDVLTKTELAKAKSYETFVKNITAKELGELLISYSKLKDISSLEKTIGIVVPDTQNKQVYQKACMRLGQAFNSMMDSVKPPLTMNSQSLGETLNRVFEAIAKVAHDEDPKTPEKFRDSGRGPRNQPTMDGEMRGGLSKKNADILNEIKPVGG